MALAQQPRMQDATSISSRTGPKVNDWQIWIVLAATALVYSEVVRFQFVNFDDDVHVYENEFVRTGLTPASMRWAFAIHGPSQWHPLAWFSHQLDCQLFGMQSGWHHALNLVYHLIGSGLLFVAMQRLWGRTGVSLFIAGLFALHPLNVESVAWVSERRNVLCGVFWMTGLIAWANYARTGGWLRYLAVCAATAAALMAKPMAVTLPCVYLLLDYWPLRRLPLSAGHQPAAQGVPLPPCPAQSWSRIVLEKLPLLALAAGAGWLSYLCQESIQTVSSLAVLPLKFRIENALVSCGLYLRRMVWPVDLAVLYPHPALSGAVPDAVLRGPAMVWGGVLSIVTLACVGAGRQRPAVLVGWLWFLGTLVPMIGLVQVGEQQLADRYIYLPMIGLAVALSGLTPVAPAPPLRRVLAGVAALALAGCAAATWVQVGYWSDSVTLFARTVVVTGPNSRARLNLGAALFKQGRFEDAVSQYEAALTIDPDYGLAWFNLGIVYHQQQQLPDAMRCFERAIACSPRTAAYWMRLGAVRGHAGDLDGSIRDFEHALTLDPMSNMGHVNLGLVLEAAGRLDEAIQVYERGLEFNPADVRTRELLTSARAKRRTGAMPDRSPYD
jgi:cytochrome c-type biogenesis protein CcmH/NrfG